MVRAKILMTKTSDELKVHIDERHLLKSLGGTGDWSWSYEPVRPSENEKMEDLVGKNRELRHRQTLVQAHMDITRQWCDEPAPGQETGNDHDVKKLNMSQETNGTALLRCYVMYHMRVHYFVLVRPASLILSPDEPTPTIHRIQWGSIHSLLCLLR